MAGYLFGNGPAGHWDDSKVSCPVVLREDDHWRMWYYGHDRTFPGLEGEETISIPMGRSGTAVSADGLHWERQAGPGTRGSVLDPSGDPARFDEWQVGCTDVVPVEDGYRLYFMGSPRQSIEMMGAMRPGYPIRIGLAIGDGLRFTKVDGDAGGGAVLANGAAGEWDEWLVSCPRILRLADRWRMYYHARAPRQAPSHGYAESSDGIHWEKRGICFGPNPDGEKFDADGVISRHVLPYQGGYLMAYEALPPDPVRPYSYSRIGIAFSADGLRWERQYGEGYRGSSIDVGADGSWDSLAIGTPWLVERDGGFWCYYVGYDARSIAAIGLAVSDGSDLRRWHKIDP